MYAYAVGGIEPIAPLRLTTCLPRLPVPPY